MNERELVITSQLAKLKLEMEEIGPLSSAVETMLEYFAKMDEIDVDKLDPTTHAVAEKNILREDKAATENISDELINRAPKKEDRFFIIPKVIG